MKPAGYYGNDLSIFDPAECLRGHGHILVRRILTRDDELTDALLDLAAGKQTTWTHQEWEELLSELSGCDDTVEDWLVLNS